MNSNTYISLLSDLPYQKGGIWLTTEAQPDIGKLIMPPIPAYDNNHFWFRLSHREEIRVPSVALKGPVLLPKKGIVRVLVRPGYRGLDALGGIDLRLSAWTITATDAGVQIDSLPESQSDTPRTDSATWRPTPESEKRVALLAGSLVVTGGIDHLLSLLPPVHAWHPQAWASLLSDIRSRGGIARAERNPGRVWRNTGPVFDRMLVGNTISSYLAASQLHPEVWGWTYSLPHKELIVIADNELAFNVRLRPAFASIHTDLSLKIVQLLRRLKYKTFPRMLTEWSELDVLISARAIQIINDAPPWYKYYRERELRTEDIISQYLPIRTTGGLTWISESDVNVRHRQRAPQALLPGHRLFIHTTPYVIALSPWVLRPHPEVFSTTASVYGPRKITRPIESLFATLTSSMWVPSARTRLLMATENITPDRVDEILITTYLAWSALLNWALHPLYYRTKGVFSPKRQRPPLSAFTSSVVSIPWEVNNSFLSAISSLGAYATADQDDWYRDHNDHTTDA